MLQGSFLSSVYYNLTLIQKINSLKSMVVEIYSVVLNGNGNGIGNGNRTIMEADSKVNGLRLTEIACSEV